ncbi:ATP-binding cassette domain-containing protein [Patescibacteria group bacterium]|nr:ATP-binding cassette domain-containing protein [Patescibacteria group bacterium]MBU1722146.1 ATP-binding cassette domain-containing protein [Patescibacteria group bacterium]MBU1901195.1 ATP-binding cassette domain-containing protein [Patescibacteria group bacterium]
MSEHVCLRFDNVDFEYVNKKLVLEEASFSVRTGSKITLMGQNGAGKSTIFKLIKGEIKPKSGKVHIDDDITIGTALQVVSKEDIGLDIEEYFSKAFVSVPGNIKSQIHKVMEAVNLTVPLERKVGELSGGQQARLLLAYALIQNPDILLLDEPTNNLDKEGIDSLIQFLVMYDKTVIVISHDADFLNCFTEGVIYLDVFTKKVETYVGDYYSVVEEIQKRIDREIKKNAQLKKEIQDNKDKVNFFAHKGGKMRKLASKLKEEVREMEENKVDVRREDKTIRDFTIEAQDIVGDVVKIHSVKVIKNHEPHMQEVEMLLRQKDRLLISGPNGVGKSTLLRSLLVNTTEGIEILENTRIGYYSQDFATLNYDQTVFDSLKDAMTDGFDVQDMRSVAAGFLLTGEIMGTKISHLSEGQKGLLSFARLVLMEPGLLILDEPTNHINFRHIPVIARAINKYEGTIILISHMKEFVDEITFTKELDLGRY